MKQTDQANEARVREARRRFLTNCGKFIVMTPPMVTLVLSASERG